MCLNSPPGESLPASSELVRWLCAVLAPGLGWRVQGKPPVWAAYASRPVRVIILIDEPVSLEGPQGQPPNSSQATELLVELCDLFGLQIGRSRGKRGFEPLAPYTAAFMAALALPLYRSHRLQPRLTLSPLERKGARNGKATSQTDSKNTRQYLTDLRYYMTLSLDVKGLNAILWSMFWQPDIQCNLVSPWLSGTLDVLRPVIEAGETMTLAKPFAARRPRLALWWLGIIMLGHSQILEDLVLWLETTDGRSRYSLAAVRGPDITVAAWTGSPQSFWDEGIAGPYLDPTDFVPRADVLRCRLNLQLQSDHWNNSFLWRPFGYVRKADVELDIWPWLERGSTREYLRWIWWIEKDAKPVIQDIQYGFRRDTGRYVDIRDNLEQAVVEGDQDCPCYIHKAPSVAAVGRSGC